ncbi:MAG TPA: DUF2127 domain-containing protein [Thermodesulfobacteriota bacterium]|nr:DUF2127 domain-containing protein [Thermodesulfobacteriota bacterium]
MKKSPRFLQLIILYKSVIGLIEVFVATAFLRTPEKNLEVLLTRIAKGHNLDTGNRVMDFAIEQAGLLSYDLVMNITMIILLFGILNLIESYGLHMRRRWAEWLTIIGTSAMIPYELYELAKGFSSVKVWVLVINCAIVYYLARHKELFKSMRVVL